MTLFQELDEYLNQDFSDDYWFDDAKLYACNLIQEMQSIDWDILLSIWKTRSQQWQIRCAEILSWATPERAIPLLLEMIQMPVPDDGLALMAADSLNSIELNKGDWSASKEIVERLQLLAQKSDMAKIIVNNLLSKFN